MCIHDKVDIQSSLLSLRTDGTFAVMWIEDEETGTVYGMDCVQFREPQEVANCIRNVTVWHPSVNSDSRVLHMEDVNLKRIMYGLTPLTEKGLPVPTGKAPPSSDAPQHVSV